jgi:hypothetical protein
LAICRYCSQPLPFLVRLFSDTEFCCREHRKLYHEELNRNALKSLLEAQSFFSKKATVPAKTPPPVEYLFPLQMVSAVNLPHKSETFSGDPDPWPDTFSITVSVDPPARPCMESASPVIVIRKNDASASRLPETRTEFAALAFDPPPKNATRNLGLSQTAAPPDDQLLPSSLEPRLQVDSAVGRSTQPIQFEKWVVMLDDIGVAAAELSDAPACEIDFYSEPLELPYKKAAVRLLDFRPEVPVRKAPFAPDTAALATAEPIRKLHTAYEFPPREISLKEGASPRARSLSVPDFPAADRPTIVLSPPQFEWPSPAPSLERVRFDRPPAVSQPWRRKSLAFDWLASQLRPGVGSGAHRENFVVAPSPAGGDAIHVTVTLACPRMARPALENKTSWRRPWGLYIPRFAGRTMRPRLSLGRLPVASGF